MREQGRARDSLAPVNHSKAAYNGALRLDWPVMAGIVLLGSLLYSNTLHVPWYLDDRSSILYNQDVHMLGSAWDALFTSARGWVNLTFAVNYSLGGDNVVGYHVVNIAIHLLSSCVVFLLLKRAFRKNVQVAVGGSLIFLAHPLQTQAVTYIAQRTTSLAALFFFLAIYFYTRTRELPEAKPGRHWLFYAGALVCGALAVFIKPNTAVLPAAILLFDRYFLSGEPRLHWKKLLCYLAPFALAPAWVASRNLLIPIVAEGEALASLGGMPGLVHLEHLSPLHYLFTEFSVIWLYLRLLVFPQGQALDYDYPIVATLFTLPTMVALSGIIILLLVAVAVRKRFTHLSFGILWFFLTLAIESTIIPLDPVFEHRLYLPMFGVGLATMACFAKLPSRVGLSTASAVILLLAVLTWQRNELWNDPVAFYKNNLLSAPGNERVYLELGNALLDIGQVEDAQRTYESGLKINPGYSLLSLALSKGYVISNDHQEAIDLLKKAIDIDQGNADLYANLGGTYLIVKQYDKAIDTLKKGLVISQDNVNIYLNLGVAYEQTGRFEEALASFRRAIELDERDPKLYYSLGVALSRHGEFQEALQAYLMVLKLDPTHAKALYNAALASHEAGNVQLTSNLREKLQQVNPRMGDALDRRISLGRN